MGKTAELSCLAGTIPRYMRSESAEVRYSKARVNWEAFHSYYLIRQDSVFVSNPPPITPDIRNRLLVDSVFLCPYDVEP